MAQTAYSSVSIRDYTDLGSIRLYLTSSQPISVIYNPTQGSYQPDWSESNLVITPVIQYNGQNVPLTSSALSITYTRKEGSSSATALTTGEAVANGVLTVSANKIADVASGQLTYICHVTYTDPDVGVAIPAEELLTFTLISEAVSSKFVNISGENVFLYDSNRDIIGSNIITLTRTLNNVSMGQWQYKNAQGNFVPFPTGQAWNPTNTGETIKVSATANYLWIDDRYAVIKVTTSDENVYDIHQISKVYDGAAGDSNLAVVLSNQSHYVPCDANGNVTSWEGADTTIHIYDGGTDVTSDWTINVTTGTSLTGSYNSSTYTFTPSALSADTGYAEFTCTLSGTTLTARYTITKSKMGADGDPAVVYTLKSDPVVLNLNEDTFTPASISFTGYVKTGSNDAVQYTTGRYIIRESVDGSTFVQKYASETDEGYKLWMPTSANVKMVKCELYKSGGTTTKLDEQTVVVVSDGMAGISTGLGNYQDVIPCSNSGSTLQRIVINVPFYAYAGITRIPVTASVSGLPNGITASVTDGTSSADGNVALTFANNSTLGGTDIGTITITLSVTYNNITQTSAKKYTWTKNLKALDGEKGDNAYLLQIYSEDGGVIRNSSGTTTLKLRLTDGTEEVTPTSVQWAKFTSGAYVPIQGETGTSLVVSADMVDDIAFIQVTAVYNTAELEAYYTVDDLIDPYTAYTFATVGEFKNGEGYGAVYTRVYQNGIEVDPIKSTTFSASAPNSPSTGDFYYYLDIQNKTCTLKKYDGSAWVNATETDDYTYSYYRLDASGESVDDEPYQTQRCIYVDPSIISGRMVFVCEVSN